MKVILTKVLALSGLCVLFASAGSNVFAQGYYHRDEGMYHPYRPGFEDAHQRIRRLQRVYAHSVHTGNTEAARRAHWRAMQIRERLRERRHFSGYHSGAWPNT